MKIEFDVKRYLENLRKNTSYFYTFINRDSLAAGLLRLSPGEEDTQAPHESDEIYYVLEGDGYLRIGKKDYVVDQGKSFFVEKNVDHKFHSNTKELIVLYFFGGPDL